MPLREVDQIETELEKNAVLFGCAREEVSSPLAGARCGNDCGQSTGLTCAEVGGKDVQLCAAGVNSTGSAFTPRPSAEPGDV